MACLLACGICNAEIVYQDDFSGAAGASTTTIPEVSSLGFDQNGFATGLDGSGRLESILPSNASSGYRVRLGTDPLTIDPSIAKISYTVTMRTPTNDWVMIGFQEADVNGLLVTTNNVGPIVQFNPVGIILRGGTWGGGTVSAQFLNTYFLGSVITAEMTYHVSAGTMDLAINGSTLTNGFVLNHEYPVGTNSDPVVYWLNSQLRFQPSAANGGAYIDSLQVETFSVPDSGYVSLFPFPETFEVVDGVSLGAINGQNGWVATGGTSDVQSAVVQAGTQALQIQDAEASRRLSNDGSALWLHFQARCASAPDTAPASFDENTCLAFFVNTNLNLVVYSNTVPVELDSQMPLDEWVRFDIYCDYDDMYWDLSMNGLNVAAGLPLYSDQDPGGKVFIGSESVSSIYVDEIDIAEMEQVGEVPDSDSDGIPDWWEQKYLGGVTNAAPDALSGNEGLTYLQAYIAGVDPATFDPWVVSLLSGGNSLGWNPVPGRLYSVYWTFSLTNEFSLLQDNLYYPQAEFIDSEHDGDTTGFYRVKVRVAQ